MAKVTGEQAFRILSLSGGGARGIFQARYLERIEESLRAPLADHVDMVAATSTGAIVGLAVAAGIPAARIRELYEAHAAEIFRARRLSSIRRGPRYDTAPLERHLRRILGNARVSDLALPVVVPTSTVNTHEPKVFAPADGNLSLVDVALASAAAPTYFKPRQVTGDARSFYDGGLWANDPSAIGLSHARDTLRIDPSRIRMLMVGTGRVQGGSLAARLDRLRPLSLETLKVVVEMVSSLQTSAAQLQVAESIPEVSRLTVNPELSVMVPLDDAVRSVEILPALADSSYDGSKTKALSLLSPALTAEELKAYSIKHADPVAILGITEANLRTFIPARKFYPTYRDGHGSISEYVSLAEREIVLVSVNLMTGESFDGVLDAFRRMLSREDGRLKATISLLDPRRGYLLEAVSGSLQLDPDEIGKQIRSLTEKARKFHASLPEEASSRFSVHWHPSLPSASAILSDAFEPNGRIQLETKAYKTPTNKAFGFEVGAGSELFTTLRSAYYNLVKDGEMVVPSGD